MAFSRLLLLLIGLVAASYYRALALLIHSQKCQSENRAAQQEREALERRRKAVEEAKASRPSRSAGGGATDTGDNAVLDTLLEKLRNGDSVGRKSRRSRRTKDRQSTQSGSNVNGKAEVSLDLGLPGVGDKTVDLARDMLAALKSDGFEAFTPAPSTTTNRNLRRSRQRRVTEFGGTEEIPVSPNASDSQRVDGIFPGGITSSEDEDEYSDHQDDPDATMRM